MLTHCPLRDYAEIVQVNCKIALRWMLQNHNDEKPKLVQVMACSRQATSHYMDQDWPRFMSPCGITRPNQVMKIAIAVSYFGTISFKMRPIVLDLIDTYFITARYKAFQQPNGVQIQWHAATRFHDELIWCPANDQYINVSSNKSISTKLFCQLYVIFIKW